MAGCGSQTEGEEEEMEGEDKEMEGEQEEEEEAGGKEGRLSLFQSSHKGMLRPVQMLAA